MKFLNKTNLVSQIKIIKKQNKVKLYFQNSYLLFLLIQNKYKYTNFLNYVLNNLNNKNSNFNKGYALKNTFSKYIINNGKFNSNIINFYNVFSYIYTLFFNNKSYIYELNYKYSKEFLYVFFKYKNYSSITYILNWVLSWIQPLFFMDCLVVPKKYRKKLKKKYLYKVKYLNINNRTKKSLKWINDYKNSLKYLTKFNRELFCYLDLILNYKTSYIFLKKITIYKKIFKI